VTAIEFGDQRELAVVGCVQVSGQLSDLSSQLTHTEDSLFADVVFFHGFDLDDALYVRTA
jgi:hypothetical protein